MYLVSCPAHVPLAVFSERAEAYRYLRNRNNIDRDYVYLNTITKDFDEVYFECRKIPRKILGYVRRNIPINPNE